MEIPVGGLNVHWPYSGVYPEQYEYMVALKEAVDEKVCASSPSTHFPKGRCMIEMPSGTGKTAALLSLLVAYQHTHPEISKIIYCTRTVSEVEKAMEELNRLMSHRIRSIGEHASTLCIAMSSRRNLCTNPSVLEGSPRIDALCRNLTCSWVRERAEIEDVALCGAFESLASIEDLVIPNGVYSLERMREFGSEKGWCPYFTARRSLDNASVVIFSYEYLLNPRIAELVSKSMDRNSVVVFDEAHNIDNVCIEALSVNLGRDTLDKGLRCIGQMEHTVRDMKRRDKAKLEEEYNQLVVGLNEARKARQMELVLANPVLPDDLLQEAVPGNIRKAEHFLAMMRRFVEYLKIRLRVRQVQQQSPKRFLQDLEQMTSLMPKPLSFATIRLSSLLRTLEVSDIDQYASISLIADFASLLATYHKGFTIIIEPGLAPRLTGDGTSVGVVGMDSVLQWCCLDASLAIKPVLDRFRSVVITSGTLSPLIIHSKILNFRPVLTVSLQSSLSRQCLCPMVVSRGSDQLPISTKFEVRNDPAVVRNYANLLVELAAIVPDGIVAFFPSYRYMESLVSKWAELGLLDAVLSHKLVFVETVSSEETAIAVENYRKACDSGRGAVLFSVARGKVSEGVDFADRYGRCVIMFGIPFVYTESLVLKARLQYLSATYQVKEGEFLVFDAMRTAAQCMGRGLRGKSDYSVIVMADRRYGRLDKRGKLPLWIGQALTDAHLNLSTDMCVSTTRRFLREMAQPWTLEEQLGHSIWTLEHVRKAAELKVLQ